MFNRNLRGDRNPGWKGDKVSYKGIHQWMGIHYGYAKDSPCEFCCGNSGSKKMNWANLDGKYTRDRKTWAILCKKCHVKYDMEHFGQFPKWTQERKKSMSEKMKGKKFTETHLENMRIAQRNRRERIVNELIKAVAV